MSLSGCKAADDGYTGRPFRWHYPTFASNIERLELAYCCMDGPGIGEAIQHMPHLRHLRHSHQTKWHGCLMDRDSGEFFAHIGKWRGESLIELSVTAPGVLGEYDGAAPFLKQFTGLKQIELNPQAQQPHKELVEEAGSPPPPTIQPAVPLSAENPAYILKDILPSSVENLQIVSSRTQRSVPSCVISFKERKAARPER